MTNDNNTFKTFFYYLKFYANSINKIQFKLFHEIYVRFFNNEKYNINISHFLVDYQHFSLNFGVIGVIGNGQRQYHSCTFPFLSGVGEVRRGMIDDSHYFQFNVYNILIDIEF